MGERAAVLTRLVSLTGYRRLALILLLVLGGGMTTIILLHHGDENGSELSGRAVVTDTTGTTSTTASPVPVTPTAPAASAAGAPSAPVKIRIESIGASAPVDPLGLNRDGTLEVPTDFKRAGYYVGRPAPGSVGPAIIVAHVDSKAGPAVFYRLRDLKAGDEVVVTREDRSEVVFVVDRVEQHAKDAFPTEAVYGSTEGATLRLITCGGSFDKRAGHYRDNLIAYAHYRA
jgi:hypothetical protein